MADKTLDLLHVRAMAFKTNLAKNDAKSKHVTKPLADNFNRLLDDIKKQLHREDAAHFPNPITFASDASRLAGYSDVLYVDLEIMIDQVTGVLDHLRNTR